MPGQLARPEQTEFNMRVKPSSIDALRISPKYTSSDWFALHQGSPHDWSTAADIVRDRLEGRFLGFAGKLLTLKDSGFVVMAIDSLLLETIQQFREGVTDGRNLSGPLVRRYLEGPHFQPAFDAAARRAFYQDIRCGLLHQAEAKRMWLIRRKQRALLQSFGGQGYILDVEQFHAAVHASLNDYLELVIDPASDALRTSLWRKMDHICSVRTARGALYEADRPPV